MAPEVDPSSSSPSSKDPHCMVVFDSCKVKQLITTNLKAFVNYVQVLGLTIGSGHIVVGMTLIFMGTVGAGSVGD